MDDPFSCWEGLGMRTPCYCHSDYIVEDDGEAELLQLEIQRVNTEKTVRSLLKVKH